jgi:excinuclease UvrABC nuclease subunit
VLPAVPFALVETLPPVCAVYFAMTETGRILYIGGTSNLHRRWQEKHHRLRQLHEHQCTMISYYVCPRETLDAIECAMIHRFMPLLNHPWRDNRRKSVTQTYHQSSLRLPEDFFPLMTRLAQHLGISKTALSEICIRELAAKYGLT